MKITKLKLENFMTITAAELALDDRGLLLIQGVNAEDSSAMSNGSGKSTLPDALSWVLFGTTARGVSSDEVVSDKVGKNTRVTATVYDEASDSFYRITRHRKHKTGKNSLVLELIGGGEEGEDLNLSKGTDRETQKVVCGVIGCSEEVFNAAVYSAQGRMPDLPGLADKALKVLVEEASGVEIIERAYKLALKRVGVQKDLVSADKTTMESLTLRLNTLEETAATNAEASKNWLKKRDEDVLNATKQIKEKLLLAAAKADEAASSYDPVETEGKLEVERAKLTSIEEERAKRKPLEKAVEKAVSEETFAVSQVQTLKRNVQRLKQAFEDVDKLVGQPCGECGKEYCAHDLDEARKIAKEKLDKEADTLRGALVVMNTAKEMTLEARNSLTEFDSSLQDVSDIVATCDALQREIDAFKSVQREIEALRKSAKEIGERAKIRRDEENPFDIIIHNEKLALSKATRELTEAKERYRVKFAQLEKMEIAASVFGPAGVRAHILDTVTPFLNERTSEYLGALSDGNINATWQTLSKTAKGELREKFSIDVEKGRCAKSYTGLSGGEQRKVRLATALALQDLVASRASKPINLWVGDEIDDALDTAGLERLMGILERKARERGTVLIISHNDLNDWIREQITVTRQDGESYVR